MSDPGKKKQLRLMTEVLPDPAPLLTPGGPRERTLATMNRLGAMAATVALLQTGCSEGSSGAGYGVVDPMPSPAQCAGVAATITATAVWKTKATGGLAIELTLGKPGRVDASYVDGPNDGSNWNAEITGKKIADGIAVLTVEPTPGAKNAGVSIGAVCTQGAGHVQASFELAATPADGTPVAVMLSDTW